MAQPYIGEIRMFAGNFPPNGWQFCEGQLIPISENDALFTLIGTTYGGNGTTTFALPDLRGRLPIHQGNGFVRGETGGAEEITLTVNQIPAHTHPAIASASSSNETSPINNFIGFSSNVDTFFNITPNRTMAASSISSVGGSQPHTNFQPYLCVNFIISLYGIFPSQT